ncbi:LysR substrate-binding domain-containing protein [Variovorax dokdonensis]|uniref:LysR substrate-binding domain-containing protein n=1 Tax=Variovorax dokdonensis TaxID=344883 RepID=A0ABT7NAC3_9BURK|nr:LysR substrate-binding domain-containing protein [Variovorax dokdonensis]MDM0044874.1 LysR substrate-binding domain-containing protein [Variovorax dokdonensis]
MRPENARPWRDLPPLELLRSFESAARLLSFTRAADELSLTQSAVSRQIQQLEQSLGVLLFERRHRALGLTESGRILQRATSECLERLRDATARLHAAPMLRQVAITCTPGFASLWLIPRLSHFTGSHPGVDVRISATLEVIDDLDRARLDLAVRFVSTAIGTGPALFEETVVPLCSPSVAQRVRAPSDLAEQTLLTIDSPAGNHETPTIDWEPWLEIMGLTDLRMKSTLRFTHYTDAVAAAVAGQGVVIGRLPLLGELVRDGRLVAPLGAGAATQRGQFVEVSRRGAANADAQDFIRWLRTEAALMPKS